MTNDSLNSYINVCTLFDKNLYWTLQSNPASIDPNELVVFLKGKFLRNGSLFNSWKIAENIDCEYLNTKVVFVTFFSFMDFLSIMEPKIVYFLRNTY